MILGWLLAFAAASEPLYEAPARFWDNLPIATLEATVPGRSLRLLIDSGANQSFFFPGQNPGTVELQAGGTSLGLVAFAAAPKNKVSPQAVALMSRLGVNGSLGVDFLRTHDVLLDYTQHRIFISNETSDEEAPMSLTIPARQPHTGRIVIDPSGPRAQLFSLVEQDDIFFAPASVLAGEPTACLMALDTGTGESALPLEIASQLKPTGINRRIVGFQGKALGAKEYLARISIADSPPRSVAVLGSDARGPILGGNAFGDRSLLLMLRFSKAGSWR